jgi:hypothetical protein
MHLAGVYKLQKILQIAYLRSDRFPEMRVAGSNNPLPECVLEHFRDLRRIESMRGVVPVSILDAEFEDRFAYLEKALAFIVGHKSERCAVFLDPDTGLEPARNPDFTHVLDCEVKVIWDAMKRDDVFAFYQHQTNRAGQPWKEAKARQLAAALGINESALKIAEAADEAKGLPQDVVIFYARR